MKESVLTSAFARISQPVASERDFCGKGRWRISLVRLCMRISGRCGRSEWVDRTGGGKGKGLDGWDGLDKNVFGRKDVVVSWTVVRRVDK